MADIRMTEQEREAFLAEPRIGVLSVVAEAGRPPHMVPVWYAYEPGGDLIFFSGSQGRTTRKTALLERAGVVSFTVQHPEPPYRYVTIAGHVVATERPPRPEAMLTILRRYLPEEHAQGFVAAEQAHSGPSSVLFTIRPDRWLSADFGKQEG